jgi:hypothetical protein
MKQEERERKSGKTKQGKSGKLMMRTGRKEQEKERKGNRHILLKERSGKRKWTKERAGFRKKEKHSEETEEGMRMIRCGGGRNELEGIYEEYTVCT